jgi:RNA-directed DNA polymerase
VTVLDDLKKASSLTELAPLLGYRPKGLAFILYKIPNATKYRPFTIPKKSGGLRTILAPDDRLKDLQTALRKVLEECNAEISPPSVIPKLIRPSIPTSLSHGFEKKRSIVTNAWAHKNCRFVLNLDLSEFFPSINFGRVRGFFMKNRAYALHERVATVIAQIACFDHKLPQGSPCSPVIANLVAHILDVRLAKLATQTKCVYTRYADDLTFSTNQKEFPNELAQEDSSAPGTWLLSDPLRSTINRAGFQINDSKTRMQCRPSQQTVTGLTVNAKVNIQASYYRSARAMCDSIFKTGAYYLKPLSPTALVPAPEREQHTDIPCLEGILSHVYYVKNLVSNMSGDGTASAEEKKDASKKVVIHPAYRKLYKRLLYFKHFITLDMPLIVCEGKTDNIYLRSALKGLVASYPQLGVLDEGKLKTKVRFLKHSRVEHNVLEISGGSSQLADLVARYYKEVLRYPHRPLKFPVIVLIDNDMGSAPVFGAMKPFVNPHPSITSTDPFYYVCHNLYVVKTPELVSGGISAIEDLFPQMVLDHPLDGGKRFSREKEYDPNLFYGKFDFADRVVRANIEVIDFSAFAPLFERLLAVIADYRIRLPLT